MAKKKPVGFLGRPKRPSWRPPGQGPIGAPFEEPAVNPPQVTPPAPMPGNGGEDPPTPDVDEPKPADAGVGALEALGRDYSIDFTGLKPDDHFWEDK